jgi:tetratricopeptide (TPR) repeat protein
LKIYEIAEQPICPFYTAHLNIINCKLKHHQFSMNFSFSKQKSRILRPCPIDKFSIEPEIPIESEGDVKVDSWKQLKATGVALAEDGKFLEAISAWHNYLQNNPHDVDVLDMKAQAHLATDQVSLALHCAEEVTKLKPDWADGLQTLGRCQREVGELQLSVKSFQRALELCGEVEDVAAGLVLELSSELDEVKVLCDELALKREVYQKQIQSGDLSADQLEVCRCKFHLTARAIR